MLDVLTRVYRLALVTRAVDERLWILTRQGRAGFVLTARGHEVAQIASAVAMRAGDDSAWLYYRDLGVGLALGVYAVRAVSRCARARRRSSQRRPSAHVALLESGAAHRFGVECGRGARAPCRRCGVRRTGEG